MNDLSLSHEESFDSLCLILNIETLSPVFVPLSLKTEIETNTQTPTDLRLCLVYRLFTHQYTWSLSLSCDYFTFVLSFILHPSFFIVIIDESLDCPSFSLSQITHFQPSPPDRQWYLQSTTGNNRCHCPVKLSLSLSLSLLSPSVSVCLCLSQRDCHVPVSPDLSLLGQNFHDLKLSSLSLSLEAVASKLASKCRNPLWDTVWSPS